MPISRQSRLARGLWSGFRSRDMTRPDPVDDGLANAPDGISIHASCVADAGRGVLILGRAGSGKSALALSLMGYGAALVADDQVRLRRDAGGIVASAPAAIRGRIEARFVGILNAEPCASARLALVVDMDQTEQDRLPPQRGKLIMGATLPLVHNVDTGHFAAAILQYLRAGRSE